MQCWWVNQKQTFRHEVNSVSGYMWAPKRQANGASHFSYEFMRVVKPGDVIFSYANSAIRAVGIAASHCYSFPKPSEFGSVGEYWSEEGWKVDVNYRLLDSGVRTIDHFSTLRRFLPQQFSPMNAQNGGANQAYLFKLSRELALAIAHLIDQITVDLISANHKLAEPTFVDVSTNHHILDWEDKIESTIKANGSLKVTTRDAIIAARRGQGEFRKDVLSSEQYCRVTGVNESQHLRASHIKPWRSATNEERLDPENGFSLTPTVDHLFDKGFITFDHQGVVVISQTADYTTLERMGVSQNKQYQASAILSADKKAYLDWHQNNIFL